MGEFVKVYLLVAHKVEKGTVVEVEIIGWWDEEDLGTVKKYAKKYSDEFTDCFIVPALWYKH